jgi:alginate O-acetyltransferase complex protein AlgI
MITMLLGGLWHGANWTFVVWGFLHGMFLGIHRVFRAVCQHRPRLASWSASSAMALVWIALTFHCWVVSMVVFRADSLHTAWGMLERMVSLDALQTVTAWPTLAACAFLMVLHQTEERWRLVDRYDGWPLVVRAAIVIAGWFAILLLKPAGAAPFIYFQF